MSDRRPNFADSFDRYAQIVSFATKNKRRIWSKDVSELLSVHQRSAQRYLIQLEKKGYLVGDGEYPIGYMPSEKAKQLFGVTA
jgi:Mn-dependent DtxR family transcriptional regulator